MEIKELQEMLLGQMTGQQFITLLFSCLFAVVLGKIEFTIIERETFGDFNIYTALLDNGTVCSCYYENGTFTVWELPF